MPTFAPCTVTDDDPFPTTLILRIELRITRSSENPELEVPNCHPMLITICRDPSAPCVKLHRTDVSDSQTVASHPECPPRARPVLLTSPMLAPCTVTETEPVAKPFCRRITLNAPTSTDHPCVLLPPCVPDVNTTRRVPRAPCVTLHLTDVSDSQSVASHPV